LSRGAQDTDIFPDRTCQLRVIASICGRAGAHNCMERTNFTTRPLRELHTELVAGRISAKEVQSDAVTAVAKWQPSSKFMVYAPEPGDGPWDNGLRGLPMTVKDLFDAEGTPTTCGSAFYADERGVPRRDAGYVERWRRAGAAITGKTHLHEFAYGITGENGWLGDCTIPGREDCLTGGSSSGAAASVHCGAACIALGTDTGGSLRVPAALCGVVSVRQSLGFGELDGAFPLAPTFDTVGWMQRHLSDVSWVAHLAHPEIQKVTLPGPPRVASLVGGWMAGVDPEIVAGQRRLEEALKDSGAVVDLVEAAGWGEALEIFTPIQAADAAAVHAKYLSTHSAEYDAAIRARLEMGAGLDPGHLTHMRARRAEFCAKHVAGLFMPWDFLLAPVAPVTRLATGEDHQATRQRILRLTTPASLAGLPVLTVPLIPGEPTGLGYQVIGRRGADADLWAFAEWMGGRLRFPI
jgi:Asp-tRNA(Asn)/Glu-tRNA(Gln) amidotransferase A subunit family amidase